MDISFSNILALEGYFQEQKCRSKTTLFLAVQLKYQMVTKTRLQLPEEWTRRMARKSR